MSNDPSHGHLTTDRTQIRSWGTAREAVPVSETDGKQTAYTFVHREDLTNTHEELGWDEFVDALEHNELVFIYRDDEPPDRELGYFGIASIDRVVSHTDLERDELEGRLREGESVRVELADQRNPENPADEVVAMGGGTESRDGEDPMGGGIVVKEEAAPMGGGTHTTPHEIPGAEALSSSDQGKTVVDHAGEPIGAVATVEDDLLFIDPHPGVVDRLRARFGWGEPEKDAYPVERSHVREVTDDQVVLEREESDSGR